eukprot:11005272-Lingulodinium_polyedra.AAC.1
MALVVGWQKQWTTKYRKEKTSRACVQAQLESDLRSLGSGRSSATSSLCGSSMAGRVAELSRQVAAGKR